MASFPHLHPGSPNSLDFYNRLGNRTQAVDIARRPAAIIETFKARITSRTGNAYRFVQERKVAGEWFEWGDYSGVDAYELNGLIVPVGTRVKIYRDEWGIYFFRYCCGVESGSGTGSGGDGTGSGDAGSGTGSGSDDRVSVCCCPNPIPRTLTLALDVFNPAAGTVVTAPSLCTIGTYTLRFYPLGETTPDGCLLFVPTTITQNPGTWTGKVPQADLAACCDASASYADLLILFGCNNLASPCTWDLSLAFCGGLTYTCAFEATAETSAGVCVPLLQYFDLGVNGFCGPYLPNTVCYNLYRVRGIVTE